jgi:hypothetical protein
MLIWIMQMLVNELQNLGVPGGQQDALNGALVAAIVVGVSLGFSLGSMMHWVAMSFFGERQEKLLVDCWDALNQLLAERKNAFTSAGLANTPRNRPD